MRLQILERWEDLSRVQIVWNAIELNGSQEHGLLSFRDCEMMPKYLVSIEPKMTDCRETLGNN
jgi:hypothetical protein